MSSEHGTESQEPPVKRRRLSDDKVFGLDGSTEGLTESKFANLESHDAKTVPAVTDEQSSKETRAGIIALVHPDTSGFSGILKQRYTDFLVNEVLLDGRVLHLTKLGAPKRQKTDVQSPEKAGPQTKRSEVPQKHHDGTNGSANASLGGAELSKGDHENGVTAIGEEVQDEDKASLTSIFGEAAGDEILSLYRAILRDPVKKPKDFRPVTSAAITDKEQRTQAHQLVRRVFSSKLETTTANNETILITAAPRRPVARGAGFSNGGTRNKNNPDWAELGGDYLHFSLYKENKDTMEVIFFIASQLKVSIKHFQFGGTKDRRAVTVQRCSAYRVRAEHLSGVGRKLRGSRIGDMEYCPIGLELGDLGGNEFLITLRDCHVPNEEGLDVEQRLALTRTVVQQSVEAFKRGGFLNYYGLQRFGSFATSTDQVGLKLLQGDLSAAVADILAFNPAALEESGTLISSDDRARAEAIHIWNTTNDSSKALDRLPRKFSAESNIIRYLGVRDRKTGTLANLNDPQGALQTIPRNLRLMYVHAYQSRVWNLVAGKRWKLCGPRVVEGDLVLLSEHASKTPASAIIEPIVDDQGEPIILASASSGTAPASGADGPYEQARPLTAEEAASGAYNIFDIVLPLPGYDVVYPPNVVGEEYKTLMASEEGGGLDPYDMRRSWKELSLSGSYRKVLAKPGGDMGFEVKAYEKVEEQLVETDLQKLLKNGAGEEVGEHPVADGAAGGDGGQAEKKLAVILKMRLGPSQYATMALRELMKQGVVTYKPDYGSGR